MSKIETNTIDTVSGTTNLTIGSTNSSTVTFENGAVTGHCYPAFHVRLSGNQSLSNNVATTIAFDTEDVDTDSAFASNTFTVPSGKGGKYFIYANLRFQSADDFEAIRLVIRKNSTNHLSYWGRNEYYQNMYLGGIIDLAAADTVDVQARQSSGGSINVGASDSGTITFFGGYRIGA
ncbi:hypothetical protein HTVC115P_gp59 [Pelagibacter phage HTVC115P]|nr:hypothetical protein HTVC115P_gp59 [Pelagibacter phage HTVC115P]|tara:strand:+ start:62 stop:592 length:531 start_codon:yes stop_codon:yes gene_type:complete